MDNRILDFTFISQLSDYSITLSHLKKLLWKNERKLYNRLKNKKLTKSNDGLVFKVIDSSRERTNYFVMQGPEVTVTRGLQMLDLFEEISQTLLEVCNGVEPFDSELRETLDRIDGLRVMMKLSDHEKSFFADR